MRVEAAMAARGCNSDSATNWGHAKKASSNEWWKSIYGDDLATGWFDVDRRDQLLRSASNGRKSTDVWMACLFVSIFVYMGYAAFNSVLRGDTKILHHGRDFQGRLCGVSPSQRDKPYVYWPVNPQTNMIDPSVPVCVARCFTRHDAEQGESVRFPDRDPSSSLTDPDTNPPPTPLGDGAASSSSSATSCTYLESFVYPTTSYGGTYCFPLDIQQVEKLSRIANLTGAWMTLVRGMKTIQGSAAWIGFFTVVTLAGCACYVIYMRCIAGPLVALVITLTPLLTVGVGVYFILCGLIGQKDPVPAAIDSVANQILVYLGVGMCCVGLVLIICVILLREKAQMVLVILDSCVDCFWSIPKFIYSPFLWVSCSVLVYYTSLNALLYIFTSSIPLMPVSSPLHCAPPPPIPSQFLIFNRTLGWFSPWRPDFDNSPLDELQSFSVELEPNIELSESNSTSNHYPDTDMRPSFELDAHDDDDVLLIDDSAERQILDSSGDDWISRISTSSTIQPGAIAIKERRLHAQQLNNDSSQMDWSDLSKTERTGSDNLDQLTDNLPDISNDTDEVLQDILRSILKMNGTKEGGGAPSDVDPLSEPTTYRNGVKGVESNSFVFPLENQTTKYTSRTAVWCLVWCFWNLWLLEFFCALMQFTIAFCVSVWYFTLPDVRGRRDVPNCFGLALWVALRYHLGTLALGSFFLTFFRWISKILNFIERRWNYAPQLGYAPNLFVRMCSFLLAACERLTRVINQVGFVECVLNPKGYFICCEVASCRLKTQLPSMTLLHGLTAVLSYANIVFATFSLGGITYCTASGLGVFCDPTSKLFIDSPIFLTGVIMVLCAVIMHMCMLVFDLIAESIFYCYLIELGDRRELVHAPNGIRSTVEENEAECLLEKQLENKTEETFTNLMLLNDLIGGRTTIDSNNNHHQSQGSQPPEHFQETMPKQSIVEMVRHAKLNSVAD